MSGHPPVVRSIGPAELSLWRGLNGERRLYIPVDGYLIAMDVADWHNLVDDVERMLGDAEPADPTADTVRMPVAP